MTLDILRKIGLSDGEMRVYEALLNLGSVPLNQIHEKVGIERRNIYDILNKLIERGLVTYISENRRRCFQLAHPNRLLGYLDEKKEHLEQLKQQVAKDIPDLVEQFEHARAEVSAEVYRGAEGIKAVWEDMLNYKDLRWIGSGMYVPTQFPVFFKHWDKRVTERKIKSVHLFRHERKSDPFARHFPGSRFLPPEFSGNPTVTVIFGNKVAQFLFGTALFAFVIESKELADNYRRYHKYLWENVAKP
ncbi:MAG TPA: helix-turn-helix domain-containing protein [Candidatus Nanoarchaeia archaeon]|nr:helix-turn-helix domain-containing protein [Candidatus Nanoarchaeia archaeon]